MNKHELRNAGIFTTLEGIRLYSKIRVRLVEPANVALVGLFTPESDGVGLNRKVSVPHANVESIEVIAPPTDRL